MVGGYVGIMTALGMALRAWFRGRPGAGRATAAWGGLWLLTAGGVVPILDGGLFGSALPAGWLVASAMLGAVLAVYVAVLARGVRG